MNPSPSPLTTLNPLASPPGSVIWKIDNKLKIIPPKPSQRKVEGRNAKNNPLDPARFFGSAPETDKGESQHQAWWCPETETPTIGSPIFEGTVGKTPLINLSDLLSEKQYNAGVRLLAKVEYYSPGYSMEDRFVWHAFDCAEAEGLLKPGIMLVSSRADIVSTAVFAASRGYSCTYFVSPTLSAEQKDGLKAFGVRVVSVDQGVEPREELIKFCSQNSGKAFDIDQFVTRSFKHKTCYLFLGPEVWNQTNGDVTDFVSCIPSITSGTGQFLCEKSKAIQVVQAKLANEESSIFKRLTESSWIDGVDGEEFYDLAKQMMEGGEIRSLTPRQNESSSQNSSALEIEENNNNSITNNDGFPEDVDDPGSAMVEEEEKPELILSVTDQEAIDVCFRLAREEGICAGALSGINVAAALKYCEGEGIRNNQPSIVVTTLPDLGVRFLSSIYNEDWVKEVKLKPTPFHELNGCLDLKCEFCTKGLAGGCKNRISGKSGGKTSRRKKNIKQGGEEERFKKYSGLIGNTPIIDLSHLIDKNSCKFPDRIRVLAKCEFFNPGFSLKDRIARNILDRAEAKGFLKPGMTVVAASSGNTGASTAMLCAMRGYHCIITTCPKCSKEKADAIKAYGAHLIVTASGLSEDNPDHYMNVARRLVAQNHPYFFDVDQYDTKANPEGHYLTLGPEIYEQSQCEITHFICAGSTGGTISGVGKYLKEQNPRIKVVLADPVGSVFSNYFTSGDLGKPGKYLVEGVGKGSIPGAMDFKIVDGLLPVTDNQAFQMCSRLSQEEGACVGGSSGLNVFAAIKLAETIEDENGAVIVTVMPDLGIKYLTKIYNDKWLTANSLDVPDRRGEAKAKDGGAEAGPLDGFVLESSDLGVHV